MFQIGFDSAKNGNPGHRKGPFLILQEEKEEALFSPPSNFPNEEATFFFSLWSTIRKLMGGGGGIFPTLRRKPLFVRRGEKARIRESLVASLTEEEEEEEAAFNPISELRKPEGEIEEGKVLRRRRRRGGQHFCLLLLLLLSFFFFLFRRRPFKGPKKLFFAIPPHLHFPLSILHSRESSRLLLLFHLSLLPPPKSKIHNLPPPFIATPPICPDFRSKLFLPSSLLSWFLAGGNGWMRKRLPLGVKKPPKSEKKRFLFKKS